MLATYIWKEEAAESEGEGDEGEQKERRTKKTKTQETERDEQGGTVDKGSHEETNKESVMIARSKTCMGHTRSG